MKTNEIQSHPNGRYRYHVFFCPKDENLDDIAKHICVDRTTLANLEQGHYIIKGNFYDKFKKKNKPATLSGMTCPHDLK